MVQHHLEEFVQQFKWALTSRQVFKWLQDTRTETLTDIQRAARFYCLQHNCFGGKVSGQTPDEVRAMIASTTPTGRFTTAEQVADLVVFLASDRSGNTNGSDYRIDGGFVTTL